MPLPELRSTDPVVLTPGQYAQIVQLLTDLDDGLAELERRQHVAKAARHPCFSRKALRRWIAWRDAVSDARWVLADAAVHRPVPLSPAD